MKNEFRKEVEVFGVTYDRYVLFQLHRIMTRQLGLKNVVEMPSHGAKAAGSLYSIGFAAAGCHVTLVNPEMEMMYGWDKIGLQSKVSTLKDVNVSHTGLEDNSFDLAFNFVTWTELADPVAYLREMKRVSKKYVLLVTCNNFQPGYPWHRLIHMMFDFPWTHGQVKFNHITTVKKLFRSIGFNILEYGAIDSPGWPDPSGPRDIRLHRRYASGKDNNPHPKNLPHWEVPFLEYVRTDNYPGWMKKIGLLDMALRKGAKKLFISHLFYILGKKDA